MKKKSKEWFINQYTEIHDNLSLIEKEIEEHLKNKIHLLDGDKIIEELKKRALKEVDRLNKTRENERKVFNY